MLLVSKHLDGTRLDRCFQSNSLMSRFLHDIENLVCDVIVV